MDWKQLEDAFTARAQRAIGKMMRENPNHHFYAIALHESYRELDGQITLPWAAANSVECLPAAENGEEVDYEYNPADWRWDQIVVDTKELSRLAAALEQEANRGTQTHWRRTEKRFMAAMVRVVKRLYSAFKDHPQTTSDFIVYFDDEDGDIELLRKCVPRRLYIEHFGKVDASIRGKHALAALPESQQLDLYLKETWKYGDEIAKLGNAAVDRLIDELKSKENGATAARLLAKIGNADEKVIRALRREVRKSSDAAMWSAMALGLLGDGEFLLTLTDDDATRADAIGGIMAPLRSWADDAGRPIPLDYRMLERVVQKRCQKCNRLAKKKLKPGSVFCQIKSDDVDEALQGLRSRYLVIRQHAVCVLGERSLGKAASKSILPALVESLSDRHPNVRRLALWSISEWKAAAKPYRGDLKRLLKDPDADVRFTARQVLA